jgi:hypothetical protein
MGEFVKRFSGIEKQSAAKTRYASYSAAAQRPFTLVGIAGEDDLDAPNLDAGPNPAAEPLDHRIIVSNRTGKLRQRNVQRLAMESGRGLRPSPSSEHSSPQAFGRA